MSEDKPPCTCDLCQARELGVHPWELMCGQDSKAAAAVRENPGQPIWVYDEIKRSEEESK